MLKLHYFDLSWIRCGLVIRLEASLQTNIGFTLERALTVFTRSDITPSKVNRLSGAGPGKFWVRSAQ